MTNQSCDFDGDLIIFFPTDTKDEESDNEDNSQEDDEAIKPKRNAFELLDDDDED